MDDRIKIRVTNSYKGTESQLFGGRSVPVGAVLTVPGPRAREIIAAGNGVPVLGPSEQKAAEPGTFASEVADRKKGIDAPTGQAAPLPSSRQGQASTGTTAPRSSAASQSRAGRSSR